MADSSHLEKMGRELKCPICLSLFSSAVSLTCNHVFCNLCIEKSMKSDSSCPVCKVPYRRREVRPAPHMDNLVSIYKNMEIASGVNMFLTQPIPSAKTSDQESQRQESDCCQKMSKNNRKIREKQQKKSRKKSSDPVKPSFPTKKRVQVPQDPSSETPVRERIESGLRQSTGAQQVEPPVLLENHATQRKDSVFTPFFWLRDEDDVEKSSQQTDADQTMVTPPNAPCFSDLKDSDDDIPANEGTTTTAGGADCFDSEMFEWTQKTCSPELWSSPVKLQVPDSEEAMETNVEVCKIADNLEVKATGKDKKSTKRCRKSSQRVKKNKSISSVGDFPIVHPGSEEVIGRIIAQEESEGNITLRSCSKRTSVGSKEKKPKAVAQTRTTTGEHRTDKSEVNTNCLSSSRAEILVDGNKKSAKRRRKSSQGVKKNGSTSFVGDFPTVHPGSEEVAGRITTPEKFEGNTTLGSLGKRTSESINVEKRKIGTQTGTATGERRTDNLEVNTNGLSSPRTEILVDGNKVTAKRGRKSSQTVKSKDPISSVGDIPVFPSCSEEVPGRIITKEKSEGNFTLRSCSKRTRDNLKKVRLDKSSVQPNSKSDHELESRKKQKVVTKGALMDNKAAKYIDGSDKDSSKTNSSTEPGNSQFFIEINIAPPAVNDAVLHKCGTIPKKFKCAFCQSTEDSEATGPMVHYVNGKPVAADYGVGQRVIHAHRNCTEWAPNVYFEEDNAINLEAELARSKRIKCCCCDVKGAALGCYEKSCRKSFHVPCAKMIQQCRWDNDNFVMLCPLHASSKLPNELVRSQKKKQTPVLKRSVQTQHSEASAKNTARQWSHPGIFRKVVLCCSALTNEEREFVYKFERLSGVTEVKKWDSSVSHVIASTDQNGACRRTIKFLMGILEGKWILNIEWIKACIKAMELVDEQIYEIKVDTHGIKNGPQLGRLRVLNKQPKLFEGCNFFFSGDFVPSYKGYLHDLVTAAGGKVLQRKPIPKDLDVVPSGNDRLSSFIIYSVELPDKCDPNKRSVIINQRRLDAEALASCSGSVVASNSWVLNSIAGCTMQKLGEDLSFLDK